MWQSVYRRSDDSLEGLADAQKINFPGGNVKVWEMFYHIVTVLGPRESSIRLLLIYYCVIQSIYR